jgi:hypothetical protein
MVARWGLLLALLLLVLWVGGADGVYHQDVRWRAVWLHEDDGYDFAEIALLLRVHHTTIRRCFEWNISNCYSNSSYFLFVDAKTPPTSDAGKTQQHRTNNSGEGWWIVANFGLPAEGKKRWCGGCAKGHAGAGDVANKKCEDCGLKQPNFGLPAEGKTRWCGGCAKGHAGAVDVAKTKCEDCGLKRPNFGLPAEGKKRWCGGCAKGHAGAGDVGKKKC